MGIYEQTVNFCIKDTDLDIHCGHFYDEEQCLISSLNYSSPCGISNRKIK